MARASQSMIAFGAPLLALGVAALTAWIAFGSTESSLGPMKLLPVAQPSPPSISLDAPPPTTLEKISPLEAELRNSLLPFSHFPLTLGARFDAQEDHVSALQCMTAAVYYEAGQEPLAGKRAVAQVVLNRTQTEPFPKTVCGVIQQGAPRPGCQFTFMCDGSLGRRPDPAAWEAARQVAIAALSGEVDPEVGLATHYHADYVLPVWASTMFKLVKIGRHIFYRWPRARLSAPPETIAVTANASLAPGAGLPGVLNPTPPAPSREFEPIPGFTADAAPALRPAPTAGEAGGPISPPITAAPTPPPLRTPPPPRRAIPETSLRAGPV